MVLNKFLGLFTNREVRLSRVLQGQVSGPLLFVAEAVDWIRDGCTDGLIAHRQ